MTHPATDSAAAPGPSQDAVREALWSVFARRRDHRHFRGDPVDPAVVDRLLEVFELAPSVGLSQPWHVTVVTSAQVRERIHQGFEQVRARERLRFDGERRALYDELKLEGIRHAPVGLVVSVVPPAGQTLGTTVAPAAIEHSVVCAVTMLWLAATAEGLGLGWVSLVDPEHLAAELPLPEGARPLAYLCLGHPALDLDEPLLQTLGWRRRQRLAVDRVE